MVRTGSSAINVLVLYTFVFFYSIPGYSIFSCALSLSNHRLTTATIQANGLGYEEKHTLEPLNLNFVDMGLF